MRLKNLFLALLVIAASLNTVAQEKAEFKPSGKVNGKVFFNYNYDMTGGEDKESGFEIKRAYFGYDYNIAKGLKASITLDVGKNEGGSDYTAYLKKAQLEWKASSSVKVALGMIGTIQFKEQEKFWGYRYILKSFNDQYGFGASADLGIKANFKLNDAFSANAFIMNGEGYKKVQDEDGKQKFGASLIYKNKGLIAKVYADATSAKVINESGNEEDLTVSALATFIGYKFSDKFRLAAEYNQLMNGTKYSKVADNHDLEGLSFYSTYTFDKKWEVFGRYDHLTSNTLEGETEKWNLSKNGDAITTGVQYAPANGVKMAFNYRNFAHKDSSKEDQSQVYVNFEFKF
ncbi:outer membrane beta-barrel protein [Ancylomarina sp.]|uniref:outer membrane beta-barrel protein n=1 Tax=Ancylomarina sp. TaxID=1970196 RepID=UPI003563801B